jgi:CheY-like chemotaxis protein
VRITGRRAESAAGTPTARLAFADDGPGVAEPDRDHLFQRFFTTKDAAAHSGLGLFVASGIVADHGGSLSFEPGPGGGSIFTLELPLDRSGEADRSAATGRQMPEPGIAAAESHPMRVLVIDDEESIRGLLVRAMRASVDVVTAGSGPEALDLIEAGDFDGMVCDHRMPGMSGTEVYERIAAIRPELARHFVLMSGDMLNPELVAFTEETGVRLLGKPFEMEALHAILRGMAADIAGRTP